MARSEEKNRAMREGQREKILAVSLGLFVRRGFAATRIADIATEADIAQGLLYRYFESKDAILVALLEHALPRLDQAAKALVASPGSAADKIRRALAALLKGIEDNDDVGRYHLLIAMVSASQAIAPQARAILDRHARNPYATLRRILAKGQQEGTVRAGDPREMALLFWALVKGLAIHHAVHGKSLGRAKARSIEPLFLLEEVAPCPA